MSSAVRREASSARLGRRRDGSVAHLPLSMAFQPIVDVKRHTVFAYEALVRGDVNAGLPVEGRGAPYRGASRQQDYSRSSRHFPR